jgi:autotransporter-associated beta strand protein
VNLRARANNANSGTTTIRSGMLELNDGGALPANGANSNNPGTVTLAGGTLAVFVNTAGNTNPSSGQLAGPLVVTSNSTLANTQTLATGGPFRIWGSQNAAMVNVQEGVTLTIVPGPGGARFDSNLSLSTGTFSLRNNSGVLRMGSPGNGGANAVFDAGTNGGIIRAGNTTLNLGALTGAAGTRVEAQDSAGPAADTISIGRNVAGTHTFMGTIADGANTTTPRPAAVTKVGTSTQILAGANTYTGATTVNGGTLGFGSNHNLTSLAVGANATARVEAGGGKTLQAATLTVAGATGTWTGKVDVNDNDLRIGDASPAALAAVADQVSSGYSNGTWTGNGITSTTLATAYAANNRSRSLGYGTVANATLVKYTVTGDANLDAAVNGSDFALLAGNFGKTGQMWPTGDFNYDGSVNGSDFALLAGNFGKTLASQAAAPGVTASDWQALESFGASIGVPVPEPAAAGLLALSGVALCARARRRPRSYTPGAAA